MPMQLNPSKKSFAAPFLEHNMSAQKQYDALNMYFVLDLKCEEIAEYCGYSLNSVYTLIRDWKKAVKDGSATVDAFFARKHPGPQPKALEATTIDMIARMREAGLSTPQMRSHLSCFGINLAEREISQIERSLGFGRLPRRSLEEFENSYAMGQVFTPPMSVLAEPATGDAYSSSEGGVLAFLPALAEYGVADAIAETSYPQTGQIGKLNAILSFLALKFLKFERYSHDDGWCFDRGTGLFAGLNVLPKAAWLSQYSSKVSKETNMDFLRRLDEIWIKNGLLSDTFNLDFVAIPFWGDDESFENNWSGSRHKALASIQTLLVQDQDAGIIMYGDPTIRHSNESEVILEFVDFFKKAGKTPKWLVFDSKVTTYKNLAKIHKEDIFFVTIQRRSKNLNEHILQMPAEQWHRYRIPLAHGKSRSVTAAESEFQHKDYPGKLRQIFLKDNGHAKPAILITNHFSASLESLVKKYGRRALIENEIDNQLQFFHLNRNNSGIVVKVDFDLTMSILAHNIYRLFAAKFSGYEDSEPATIYSKFIRNAADIRVEPDTISVRFKVKRLGGTLIEELNKSDYIYPWLGNRKVVFSIDSSS
jgi:hypothetical protein